MILESVDETSAKTKIEMHHAVNRSETSGEEQQNEGKTKQVTDIYFQNASQSGIIIVIASILK